MRKARESTDGEGTTGGYFYTRGAQRIYFEDELRRRELDELVRADLESTLVRKRAARKGLEETR
jgi:hypothetical protein